jgi:hypothetical protein
MIRDAHQADEDDHHHHHHVADLRFMIHFCSVYCVAHSRVFLLCEQQHNVRFDINSTNRVLKLRIILLSVTQSITAFCTQLRNNMNRNSYQQPVMLNCNVKEDRGHYNKLFWQNCKQTNSTTEWNFSSLCRAKRHEKFYYCPFCLLCKALNRASWTQMMSERNPLSHLFTMSSQ